MNTLRVSLLSFILVLATASLVLMSCGTSADNEEIGQQVGDIMASIDESGGSSGSFAMVSPSSLRRTFHRLAPEEVSYAWYEQWVPTAEAASCRLSNTFNTCSSNTITRTFGGCTVAQAEFNGTVTLTWNGTGAASCRMIGDGDRVTRVPNFTVTGRRGAVLSVTKSGTNGQRLTQTSTGTFAFSNDGIRRTFTTASGSTLFDLTTQTTSDVTVSGNSRAGRTMTGGSLRITDNLSGTTCDVTPSNVTWNSQCTCAISGSWSGSCSDGKTVSIELNGCGLGRLTKGSDAQDVTFDRCESI